MEWATKLESLKTKEAFQHTKEFRITWVSSIIALMDQWGVVDGFMIAFITEWASPSSTTLAKPSLRAKLAAKRAALDSAHKD